MVLSLDLAEEKVTKKISQMKKPRNFDDKDKIRG